MKHTASRLIEIDRGKYDDMNLINQAYGSDGVRVRPRDFDVNVEFEYGLKSNTWVFYDEARERIKKASEVEVEKLKQ
ncbi:hypothetical protein ACFIJ5_01730 [Haloimpatiens sp. FM7330]|uniref:hypothetical protein n=1 Tax=Haloimpatiens sp. FM7330 TaxID=3298610 RepID=UPI00363C71EA